MSVRKQIVITIAIFVFKSICIYVCVLFVQKHINHKPNEKTTKKKSDSPLKKCHYNRQRNSYWFPEFRLVGTLYTRLPSSIQMKIF